MTSLLTVVELPTFQRAASNLLTADENSELIAYLAANPEDGDIIRNSGGIRKLRWGAKGMGKRGGARVIYFYHNDLMPLFLLTAYGKNQRADISQAQLAAMRQQTKRLKEQFLGAGYAERR